MLECRSSLLDKLFKDKTVYKYLTILISSLFFSFAAGAAAIMNADKNQILVDDHYHYAIGATFNNYLPGGFEPAIDLTIINARQVLRVGVNVVNSNNLLPNPANKNASSGVNVIGQLGLRIPLYANLGFEYGAAAGVETIKPAVPNAKDPYTVGVFIGLDKIIDRHLILNISVQPYNYATSGVRSYENLIFQTGMIGASYLF